MVYLRTLGECVIEVGEARIGPNAPHMFAALLYLALEAGRRVPRARLQELLFPTSDERSGSHSLRQLLYRLRRCGVQLHCDRTGITLSVDRVSADFHRILAPLEGPRIDLAGIRAGFLPGFAPTFSRPFAEWLEQRRAEILARIRRTLTTELSGHRSAARWLDAEQTARALLSLDAFNEEATLALAEAMALCGSKVEALQLLDAYLQEVGPRDRALRLPAAVLRRRIAERLPGLPYGSNSQFVGRRAPLALLQEMLGRAKAGDGGACHIWGEAGIGKTRLVTEFSRAAVLEGARVDQVSSQPHDVRRPMGAFSDLIPVLLKVPGSLGCSPEAIGLLTKAFKFDRELTSALSPDVREAELLSANITRAISELLDALAEESPVVLILDDAQWLDAITLRVVADLIAERKRRSLLVILTSREPALGIRPPDIRGMRTQRLEPLGTAESRTLLTQLLASYQENPESEVVEWCLGVAAGNPFFLHSLAAHYAATRDRGAIPEPLHALLAQRLDLLDGRSRRVFEACSVLGRHCTFERLEAVIGLAHCDLLDALQTLEEHGFIASDEARVTSTHVLLSDIALKSAPSSVLTVLHRSAAQALRSARPDDSSATLLWDCAEHWLQAHDSGESIAALRACGRHALEIGRPADAIRPLQRAADLARGLAVRLSVLEELLTATEIAGAWPSTLVALKELRAELLAENQARGLDSAHELLELEALLNTSADPRLVVDRLRPLAGNENLASEERLRACTLLTAVAEDLLSPELANEALRNAPVVQAAEPAAIQRWQFDLIYHATFGDLAQAANAARQLVTSAHRETNRAAQCRIRLLAGGALLRAGFVDEGCAVLEGCYSVASASRLLTAQYRAASHLAGVLRDAGRSEQALMWHTNAQAAFERLEGRDKAAGFFSNCALFALDEGDVQLARSWVDRALSDLPSARIGHAGLHFRALDLRIRQLESSFDCSAEELAELLELHKRYRGFGHHDEVMEAVWHALARKGQIAEGDRLVREYLTTYRRLRWPLSGNLRVLANQRERGVRLETRSPTREATTTARLTPATEGVSMSRSRRE